MEVAMKTNLELIEDLEKYGFECEAGPLEKTIQFEELKNRAKEQGVSPAVIKQPEEITFLERLEDEHTQVDERLVKLTAFLVKEESGETKILNDDDYNDMVEQSEIMGDYRSILAKRLSKHRNKNK